MDIVKTETRAERPVASRRIFLKRSLETASGFAAISLFSRLQAQTNVFANPPEITHKNGVLKGVIRFGDHVRSVPNMSDTSLRMFQGWDLSQTSDSAEPPAEVVGPGPTLRARVGGKIDIMLLNDVDDSHFTYTSDTAKGNQFGCDASTSQTVYPSNDIWPNCFHGSSTANLHFHGTHTDPDGLGDNVLVQVVPDKKTKQADWAAMFEEIFDAAHPPQTWAQMPEAYQIKQLGYTAKQIHEAHKAGRKLSRRGLVGHYDDIEAEKAREDGRPEPSSLWEWDVEQLLSGQWPQYVIGAYPNTLLLPEYKSGGPYKMGQAPGTHWYHAHKHGSTSLHIFNGLAGALIVEGDYDDKIREFFQPQMPSGQKFVERVMVLQQITAIQNLQRTGGDNPGTGTNQKLINGKLNPIVEMQPGEIQLWRIVNAMGGGNKGTIASSLFADMQAQGFQLRQVAADGVQFAWQNYLDQPFLTGKFPGGLTLAAGNRADILVKAPVTPKTSRFLVQRDIGSAAKNQTLFVVQTAGATPLNMHFFETGDEKHYPPFPDYLHDLPASSKISSTIEFGWGIPDGTGKSTEDGPRGAPPTPPPHLTLNGKQFGENKATADQCMPLDDTQDWLLTNTTFIAHPFHIHINPFQVIEIKDSKGNTYAPSGNFIWQDVIDIPAGGSVRIRHKFADFTGTYVLHCHILAHEDRGMMQLVRVVKPDAYPAGCKLDHIAHH